MLVSMRSIHVLLVMTLTLLLVGRGDGNREAESTVASTKGPPLLKAGHSSSYAFEGSEPFWTLDLIKDSVHFSVDDQDYSGVVEVSSRTAHGETFGFHNEVVYGFYNKTWSNYCDLAVTEKDPMAYEIYFVFKSKAYKGCGERIRGEGQ